MYFKLFLKYFPDTEIGATVQAEVLHLSFYHPFISLPITPFRSQQSSGKEILQGVIEFKMEIG